MKRHPVVAMCFVLVFIPILILAGCGDSPKPKAPAAQSSISITPSSASVAHGDTQQFSATTNTGQSVTNGSWSTSDSNVMTVSNTGLVTGVAVGTAKLTVTANGLSSSVNVTVTPVATTAVDKTGATLKVVKANSPVDGVTVQVPAGAIPDGETVHINIDYENNPPAGLQNGGQLASNTIVLTKDVAYNFAVPVSVTMPVDPTSLANGDVPIVLYWSEAYQKYVPASLSTIDRTNNTVTFETAHFTRFIAAVVPAISAAAQTTSLDTGFRPDVDGFFHPNFGSYDQPGGSSLGMTMYAAWYFSNKKAVDGNGLYSKYLEGDVTKWQDDATARELITRTYMATSHIWTDVSSSSKPRPAGTDVATALWTAMKLTGQPQPLLLKGTNWSHAVLVYAWDATTGMFQVYDNNFPGEAISLSWSVADGFNAYTKAAAYPGTIQTFTLEGIGVTLEGKEFEAFYQGAENGWSRTNFGTVTLVTPEPDAQGLALLQNDQNVPVAGTVTGGIKTPVAVAYYLNGTLSGFAKITGGQFSFTLPQLPRAANGLMMVATNDPRDPWSAFGAYGEYTLQVEGKVFIVNPGFETGDWTGWTHETHLWYNTAPYTPEKSAIVSTGNDPLDPSLPMVYVGNYAAQVNNSDDSYHISSVSQSVAVPNLPHPQLRFYWAAMLEDPQHDPSEQPYVDIQVMDDTLGTNLYYRHFYSNDPSYSGWKTLNTPNTNYSTWQEIGWQPVMIDLSTAIGHNVTIKITAADCSLGGHGGYAYFDGDIN